MPLFFLFQAVSYRRLFNAHACGSKYTLNQGLKRLITGSLLAPRVGFAATREVIIGLEVQ